MPRKEKPRPTDTDARVYEKGLATGSGELADGLSGNNSDGSEVFAGSIQAGGGVGPFTYRLVAAATGAYGTLTLNPDSGAYTYTLTGRYDGVELDNGANAESGRDSFAYEVIAADGMKGTGTIVVTIVDDVPSAFANTGSVVESGTATGNVLTDQGADMFGADGPTVAGGGVVGVAAGTTTSTPVSGGLGGTGIVGDYGTLNLNANGSYSYTANAQATSGAAVVDRFVYTIRDGDGDTSTATLQFTVSDAASVPTGFDVRAYGAKGDGVTDDTAAIQAAVDAAHAAGGGVVTLSAGTYRVSGTADKSDGCIRLLDGVTLQGAGMGSTVLKVIDNNPYAITGVLRTPYNAITHDVAVYDLSIDGNRANNVNKVDGFYCGVAPGDTRQDYNITLERVEIMNCSGYGFDPHEQTLNLRIANSVAHHNGLDGFVADFLVDSVYENNLAYANDRHGFNITTSTNGLLLLNNTGHDNGSAGVAIQRGSADIPAPSNITIQGGSFYGNAREGIYVKIAGDVTITGADVHGNQRQGIRIDGSSNVLVDGATVYNNSQEAAGVYDEIRLYRYDDTAGASGLIFDTTGVMVQNSTIYADGAVRSRYGIYESSDIEGVNRTAGNSITGPSSGTTYFAPQLVTPAQDQTGTAGTAFSYQVPPSSFIDGDSSFALTARQASGAALPAWLSFDPVTGQFTGTPPADGTFTLLVEARDASGLKDVTTFALVVSGGAPPTTITGTAGNDTLVGGSGPDDISALAGDDSLAGGGGADRLDGGDGVDVAVYASSPVGVSVSLLAGTGSGGDAEGDQLIGIENLIGSAYADVLIGNAGANAIDGGAGADEMRGGDGDDTYTVDAADDLVVEFDNLGSGGTDTLLAWVSYVLPDNVENLTLLGSAAIKATGNNKANILIGNSGDNVLDGGLGNDRMEGGSGNDSYYVNTSTDAVIELAGGGVDTVFSSGSRTLEAEVENLTLIGANAVNGTGNPLDNVLIGNDAANILTGLAGADTLNGGGGADTLRGGDGDDLYFIDDAGDLVTEYANSGLGGYDTVRSSVTYALTTNVERLILTGGAAINGTGTTAANVLIGNDAANTLETLSGNDTLQGNGGNDRLIGGSGSDSLDGGAGTDTAVYAGDRATYTISTTAGGIQIRDNDSIADGNDGTDQLVAMETAEFKGGLTVNLLAPVVLDLDGDGVELVDLAGSTAAFDFAGDGNRSRTGWIGSGDALLVLDRDSNGTVSNAGELSFVEDRAGSRSDLEGLHAFDSNGDGLLSASDDSFGQFLLWVDDNADGVAAAGELHGLADLGVAAIDLHATPTEQDWAEGANIVVNTGAFIRLDGSAGALADVALLHDPVAAWNHNADLVL